MARSGDATWLFFHPAYAADEGLAAGRSSSIKALAAEAAVCRGAPLAEKILALTHFDAHPPVKATTLSDRFVQRTDQWRAHSAHPDGVTARCLNAQPSGANDHALTDDVPEMPESL